MRALTSEELGFVSGGSAQGPMFTPQGWQQLGGILETVIVTASRIYASNDPTDGDMGVGTGSGATSFAGTALGRMSGMRMSAAQWDGFLQNWSTGMGALGGGMAGAIADARIGAAAGAVVGPEGALVGALIGGLVGYLSYVYASNGYSWTPRAPAPT